MGMLGILVPEEYGGAWPGYVRIRPRHRGALARGRPRSGLRSPRTTRSAPDHIFTFGSEDSSAASYVPTLAAGKRSAPGRLTEPTAGSDAAGTTTTAVRDGNDWVLNGSKTFTTHGSVGDIAVVFAVTDKSEGKHGIIAFVVEKGMKGFRPARRRTSSAAAPRDTAEVDHGGLPRPGRATRSGTDGEGFVDAMKILDGGRISIAALALGMAQGAYEAALAYAEERRQFGQPIAEFQAIQFIPGRHGDARSTPRVS